MQDTFHRAQKWVQELQRQGGILNHEHLVSINVVNKGCTKLVFSPKDICLDLLSSKQLFRFSLIGDNFICSQTSININDAKMIIINEAVKVLF